MQQNFVLPYLHFHCIADHASRKRQPINRSAFGVAGGAAGVQYQSVQITIGWVGVVCAIIAAKWAAEAGFSQLSQLLWAIFALVFPQLALLALYVRLLYQHKDKGLPSGHWT